MGELQIRIVIDQRVDIPDIIFMSIDQMSVLRGELTNMRTTCDGLASAA